MGYIGNQQTEGFSSIPAKQDLTGATGGTLTLTHAVSSPEAIDLYINHVRQEPTSSYSIVGTTVTLNGYTVVASDDIYVVYNSLALQTTVPPDASVSTAKIINSAVTKAKIGTTELDLATIKDSTGTNTAMTIDSDGVVKITQNPCFFITGNNAAHVTTSPIPFGVTVIDTRSGVDLANNKYVIPVAGRWQFHVQLGIVATTGTGSCYPIIRKTPSGGSAVDLGYSYFSPTNAAGVVSYSHIDVDAIADCAVGDAITVPFSQTTSTYYNGANECRFFGYFLG